MATAAAAAELKQQGAIEAAQDPNSNVSSADAQSKIVSESKKSGVAAFTFDPDASPEAKAAQARANVPDGFHHEKKPKGVAIATDIDDGKPGAYDLPPPSTAGALAPTAPPKDKTGKPLESGSANGALTPEDNDRWVEQSGWAPRFGMPVVDNGESVFDHQTWVEGKLPDTLFGDWYHNTAIIVFACLSSWTVAVFGGGLAWVFIIMAICATYYRTSIRRVRKNFRDDVIRDLAKQKLETDVESLEWINNFMLKFWPIFQPVLSQTIISSVDQVLSTATPAFLDSLRMKTFTLGSKPPRMEHVKTYPKAEDDLVIMDWKFSFRPSDKEDMTERQRKTIVNPKVVLEVRVGKAMISKGLDVIVEDFAFSGIMQVKVKLQIPFPHVEKVEISFTEKPAIEYVCKPLGGDYLGFDINFIPGLEGFILEMIHANIGPILYAPNVFPIEVAKMLSGTAVDQAIGVVAVTLYGANGLKNPDKFAGTPDPYAIVSLNNRDALAQTKIVKENANPKWNETKYVIVTSLTESLTFPIFDYNEYRKDKELGIATFPLERLTDSPEHEGERLTVMAGGRERGMLSSDIRFFPVLEGKKLEDGTQEPAPESNTGILRFTVEQAKDLDGTKSLIGQLSPYAVLLLNNKEVHTTQKLKRTNNPIWPNGSKEILITDRKSAKLGLVIKDDRELSAHPILGTYQVKLDDMMSLMEKGQEWYNLAGAKTGRAKMTMQWKPVALSGVGLGTGGYVTPIGVMRVHLKNARNLRNLETMGKSDPYVRIMLSGVEKVRTVTFNNNLNPDWDEVHYVPMHSSREKILLEVMDQETMGKDRTLGQVEIFASDYVKQSENGEYLADERKEPFASDLRMHGKGSPKGTLNYTISFYPCMNIADPEEEEEKQKEEAAKKSSSEAGRLSLDAPKKSLDNDPIAAANAMNSPNKVDASLQKQLEEGEKEQEETTDEKKIEKIRLTPEELVSHESGLIIFKLLDAELTRNNVQIEVLVDDHAFPAFVSSNARSRKFKFDEIGDCIVRELEFSKLTLRIREKGDSNSGDEKKDRTIAKLTGNTLDTLKQCLNNPTVLKLKDEQGQINNIRVSLKYIPIVMELDPSESINNMGKLRVDVLDATDLPSADRNGKSDPYCRFELNTKQVHKTQVQKKTLHPAWNETFEVDVASRTGADFQVKVYDWDLADKPDFLGGAAINLELLDPFMAKEFNLKLDGKSGSLRLRMLFRPDYVTRSRQGSSTFAGTFAAPGKVVVGVAGAPIKGVGAVGHGVGKGVGFISRGFKGKKKINGDENGTETNGSTEASDPGATNGLQAAASTMAPQDNESSPSSLPAAFHSRTKSGGAASMHSMAPTTSGAGATGSASFTVVSTTGYPPASSVTVYVKQLMSNGKASRTVHKTKHVKSATGTVRFDESFRVACAADQQFQVQVKSHATFGSDDDLGEALFFVDDTTAGTGGQEKSVRAGSGTVVIRSAFTEGSGGGAATNGGGGGGGGVGGFLGGAESPRPSGTASSAMRRSFLSKRDNGRASRETTPM